ncbi:hypothetical protein D3C76_1600000 [compost metagenome]
MYFLKYTDDIFRIFYFSKIGGMDQDPFIARSNRFFEMGAVPVAESIEIDEVGNHFNISGDIKIPECFIF